MIAQIASGHFDLADALFLIAFIVFCFVVVFHNTPSVAPRLTALTNLGLALVALAFFVS